MENIEKQIIAWNIAHGCVDKIRQYEYDKYDKYSGQDVFEYRNDIESVFISALLSKKIRKVISDRIEIEPIETKEYVATIEYWLKKYNTNKAKFVSLNIGVRVKDKNNEQISYFKGYNCEIEFILFHYDNDDKLQKSNCSPIGEQLDYDDIMTLYKDIKNAKFKYDLLVNKMPKHLLRYL